jgi:hypothetical protein
MSTQKYIVRVCTNTNMFLFDFLLFSMPVPLFFHSSMLATLITSAGPDHSPAAHIPSASQSACRTWPPDVAPDTPRMSTTHPISVPPPRSPFLTASSHHANHSLCRRRRALSAAATAISPLVPVPVSIPVSIPVSAAAAAAAAAAMPVSVAAAGRAARRAGPGPRATRPRRRRQGCRGGVVGELACGGGEGQLRRIDPDCVACVWVVCDHGCPEHV